MSFVGGRAPRFYVIAGEASGDALGAGLIQGLKQLTNGAAEFRGIGGEQMREEGVESLFPISEMAVMGLFEILPKAPKMLGRIAETVDDIHRFKPDAVITIDSKAFTLRVQKRLHKARVRSGETSPKLIHWVPPTVWAWRPGRAKVIARFLDHLLTLYPFEPKFFQPFGLSATFVGHPAAAREQGDGASFRGRYGIKPDAKVLGIMPGSRPAEVRYLKERFSEAASRLHRRYPELHIVVPTVPVVRALVEEMVSSWPGKVTLVHDHMHKQSAFAAMDLALAASGTVTLELGLAEVPMIVAYRVHPVTAFILRRLVDPTKIVLANALLEKPIIPQLLQEDCTADKIVIELEKMLDDPIYRDQQTSASKEVRKLLTADGELPTYRAARTVLEQIGITSSDLTK